MNINLVKGIYSLLLLCLLISCKDNSKSTALLKQAQNIVSNNPTEAIVLLDSIVEPRNMKEDAYMQYIITRVQAKYKLHQDVTNDTLIFTAQSYFEGKNNPKQAALANFYSGGVLLEKDLPIEAMQYFLHSEFYAKKAKENVLTAVILENLGYLYAERGLIDSTVTRYKEAMKYYDKEEGTEASKLRVINMIGRSYEAMAVFDSAYQYFQKGFDLAEKMNDRYYKGVFTHNLGVVFSGMKDYSKATEYLQQAVTETTDTKDSMRIYISLSKIYNSKKELDSAQLYIEKIKQRLSKINDNRILESLYGSLHDYYSQKGNFQEANHYINLQKIASRKVLESHNSKSLLEVEINYKQYLEKQQRKAEREYSLLVQFFVIIAVIAVFYFFNIKKRHKHQKRLIENRKLKAENRLLKLEHDNHIYLESIYQQYILKWAKIENKVNKLGLEEQQIDLPLYSEIKSMSDELKSHSNKQLINLSKSYLHSHSDIGEKAVRVLTDQELILMILCYFEYSRVAIATILDIKLEKLDLEERKSRIAARLKKAGMRDYDINVILYSEKM